MPMYEFRCVQCGGRFEAQQTIDEHAHATPACPRCRSSARVERELSSFTAVTARKG